MHDNHLFRSMSWRLLSVQALQTGPPHRGLLEPYGSSLTQLCSSVSALEHDCLEA